MPSYAIFQKKYNWSLLSSCIEDSVTFLHREAEVNNFWKIVNISTIGKFPSTDNEWEENTF